MTVVVAIRADLYGRCAEDPALAELLGTNHVLVGPMTADEYRRAIEQPALRVGVHVESALTEALVDEVGDEPGALSRCCRPRCSSCGTGGTVARSSLDAYLETGGVRGAVARLAEEVYGSLSDEQQAIARAVMLRLAAPGEGDTTVRRRVPLAEFDAERDETSPTSWHLTDRRLLTVSDGVVEVAHEALLREWPRLRAWLEEDRAGRVLHAHLMDTARVWATPIGTRASSTAARVSRPPSTGRPSTPSS